MSQQRLRLRGTKKASKDTQERLGRNLATLLESPATTLPEYPLEFHPGRGRPDMVSKSLRRVGKVFDKRRDRKWLMKHAVGMRRDAVAKAYAGALAAAHTPNQVTVATFKSPVYGVASYIRRGDAKPMHMVGVQQHHHPRLRLLVWEDHGRSGFWFFSWKGGFICTGRQPRPPEQWVTDLLEVAPIEVKRSGSLWLGTGLTEQAMEAGSADHLRITLPHGHVVAVAPGQLRKAKLSLMLHFGLQAMPPKPSEFVEVDLGWRPRGWPEGEPLPGPAQSAAADVLSRWARMEDLEDKDVWREATDAALDALDSGYCVGDAWFDLKERQGFLAALSGSTQEREAAGVLADLLDGGMVIDAGGEVNWVDRPYVRVTEASLHALLLAAWEDHGTDLLVAMYDLDVDEAEILASSQLERPKAFGSFLRRIEQDRQTAATFSRFPWSEGSLPDAVGLLDDLVRLAHGRGKGRACSRATILGHTMTAKALGWAWLVSLGKSTGKDWHFEQAARDLGDVWVPEVRAVWQASEGLVGPKGEGGGEAYVEAMRDLHAVTGMQDALPDPT